MIKSFFNKLSSFLVNNKFAFAAFFIPFAIRCIPEILSLPYPIGFDTVIYINILQHGWSLPSLGLVNFLHGTNLFYLLSSLGFTFTGDAVVLMKILGPLLLATLALLMYLYARRSLGWSGWKSLLVAVLVATYFVALRNSWDMYRQMLGLIFLMASLITLKSFSSSKKYPLATGFMVLTVLSHELTSVILLFVLLLQGVQLLRKKNSKDFTFLLTASVLPLGLFLFQRTSLSTGALFVPEASIAAEPSVNLALYIGGSLLYCYAFILPLLAYGFRSFKDLAMLGWAALCFGIVLLEMVNPNLPFYLWFRWVIILVFPLLFIAAEGLDRLWHMPFFTDKFRHYKPKNVARNYLLILLALSCLYLVAIPEYSFPYYQCYTSIVPSSMLQNSISIQDNPALVQCFNWIESNTNSNSLLVLHDGIYYLASINIHDRNIAYLKTDYSLWSDTPNGLVTVDKMVAASNDALANGYDAVYTVWWANGEGWYEIPSLPACFDEVYRAGDMAVFSYCSLVG